MHTCSPPTEELRNWLEDYSSKNGTYGHLLLEQKGDSYSSIYTALIPYFESAHLDARECFHKEIGIDLHPDAKDDCVKAQYPNCLPSKARRGLFGEVLAGLVTESYKFIGNHNWVVPIFLFRHHAAVEKYLFDLVRDPKRTREVWGRLGSDFIGISLDKDGSVVRFIAGEAKWRKFLTNSVAETLLLGKWIDDPEESGKRIRSGIGVWKEINEDIPVPHGVRQLQRLLQERDPNSYAAAIISMEKALAVQNATPIPRTDLILIAGNGAALRQPKDYLVTPDKVPSEYTKSNDLQVVEVVLTDGEKLIDTIYNNLYTQENNHAST